MVKLSMPLTVQQHCDTLLLCLILPQRGNVVHRRAAGTRINERMVLPVQAIEGTRGHRELCESGLVVPGFWCEYARLGKERQNKRKRYRIFSPLVGV